jgi:hypothetical protein
MLVIRSRVESSIHCWMHAHAIVSYVYVEHTQTKFSTILSNNVGLVQLGQSPRALDTIQAIQHIHTTLSAALIRSRICTVAHLVYGITTIILHHWSPTRRRRRLRRRTSSVSGRAPASHEERVPMPDGSGNYFTSSSPRAKKPKLRGAAADLAKVTPRGSKGVSLALAPQRKRVSSIRRFRAHVIERLQTATSARRVGARRSWKPLPWLYGGGFGRAGVVITPTDVRSSSCVAFALSAQWAKSTVYHDMQFNAAHMRALLWRRKITEH